MASANNFVTSNIFNVYDEVVERGLAYCVLCLRSEKERKLVPPKFLSTFLNSLSNAQNFRDLKVCFICEARALSAVKFITAVKFALTVDQLLNDIKINKHKNLRRDLKLRLNGLSRIDYPALRMAVECESQYNSARSRAHLSTTEVLLVSSQGNPSVGSQTQPSAKRTHSKEISKDIETVVLDDDDEGLPPTPMTLIHASQVQLQTGLQVVIPNTSNQLILHPLVPSVDGKLYAPTLQQTIGTSQTEFAYISPEQLVRLNNASSNVRKVIMPNSNQNYTVKVMDIEDSILPDAATTKVQPSTKEANTKIEARTKNNYLLNKADEANKNNKRPNTKEVDVNFKKKYNEISNESTMAPDVDKQTLQVPVNVSNGNIIVNNDSSLVKNPIPDPKRIDWEDKIPMDVISFMDATDPNPRGNMGFDSSDMGVISEVRSLGPSRNSGAPAAPDKPPAGTNKRVSVHIPCIDLC